MSNINTNAHSFDWLAFEMATADKSAAKLAFLASVVKVESFPTPADTIANAGKYAKQDKGMFALILWASGNPAVSDTAMKAAVNIDRKEGEDEDKFINRKAKRLEKYLTAFQLAGEYFNLTAK